MGDIATAYVQIIPSARGMKDGIANIIGDDSGKKAGGILGSDLAQSIKRAISVAAIGEALKKTLTEGAALEQLKGGVEKIFNDMDTSTIMADAANAYKDLNLSANQYLGLINDVGASFAANMGDAKGYEVAKTGLQAISDYASGTGKNVDLLSEKFTMITRSTSSYQSIADQFSGILPATSADFLKQAQAAGFLSGSYKKLTDVPLPEYQEAVAEMLKKGTAELGLAGNTAAETATTLSGSFAAMKAAFSNVLGNLALGEALGPSLNALAETTVTFLKGNLIPSIKNIVTALPNALSTFISSVLPANMTGTAVSMINNLASGLDSAVPQLLNRALPIINEFTGNLRGNAGQLVDAGLDLVTNLGQGIINALPSLVTNVPQIITNICGIINDNAPKLLTTGADLILRLGKGIIQAGPTILENIPAIIESIFSIFSAANWMSIGNKMVTAIGNGAKAASPSNILSTVQDMVSKFTGSIQTNLPTLVQNGTQIMINIIQGFVSGLPNFVSAVSAMLGNFHALVRGIFPTVLSHGVSIISNLLTGFMSAIPNLLTAASGLVQQLLTTFISALPSIMAHGASLVANLVSGIISNLPAVISSGTSIIAQLLSTFASHLPDLLAQGVSLIAQLIAGLISMIPDVISGAADIVKNICDTFSQTDWLSIGSNIISGIASGIANGVSVIIEAAKNAAMAAYNAAKEALGIKSPSRLFRKEVGYRLPQGAALGVYDGIYLLDRAMDDLANAANGRFTSRLKMTGSISSNGSAGFGRQIVINQYIYSQAQTAADLMREARYEAEKAVLLGV